MHSCLKHTDWPQKASRHRSCLASTHSTTATKAYLHLLFVSLIELTPLERSKTKAQPISFRLVGLMPFGRTANILGLKDLVKVTMESRIAAFYSRGLGFTAELYCRACQMLTILARCRKDLVIPTSPQPAQPTSNGTNSLVGMRH